MKSTREELSWSTRVPRTQDAVHSTVPGLPKWVATDSVWKQSQTDSRLIGDRLDGSFFDRNTRALEPAKAKSVSSKLIHRRTYAQI